ncbi:cyclic nucleotide-gated ion channel 1-like [Alnus glutinosa]|uniref:cyclic nucleotide-gated ion channel 1-like n=1 Tax=Alnus glutinosa TaxID=3517 RepID=UPI002D769125|nr:cyclic nucleotide-gated ion channel 1-like [Alnus glutinosa]
MRSGLLQIIVSKMTSSEFFEVRKFLNACVLLQYVPRVLQIRLSWKKHIEISRKLVRRVWIKVAFNFFLYISLPAFYVLGAFWYFFSIERETACWHKACEYHIGCSTSSFKCCRSLGNYTFLDNDCTIQTPNTTLLDFGMFLEAFQSDTVLFTNIPQKIMHCFWWGLRNLSPLVQNLQRSTYFWENCFAIFISIFGLLLFLYFIDHVQILNNESEYLLRLICESLKPLYYNENNYIFREGEPLNAMIFITQGSLSCFNTNNGENGEGTASSPQCIEKGECSLWCFNTNNGENGEGTASSPQCIEKGEFYREELLKLELNLQSPSKLSKPLQKLKPLL